MWMSTASSLSWSHGRAALHCRHCSTALYAASDGLLASFSASADMEDIAKAAFALLHTSDHEGKRYEMTGPEALSMTEIAEQMSLAIGKIVKYVNISPADRSRALLAAGLPPICRRRARRAGK